MENAGINIDNLNYLDQKAVGYQEELHRLEDKPNERLALLEQKQNVEADRNKLIEYLEKMRSHKQEKVSEVERQTRCELELAQRLQGLETGNVELEQECRAGRVPSLEAERSGVLVADYRRQVDQCRQEVDNVDKEIWQKEIQVKIIAEIGSMHC